MNFQNPIFLQYYANNSVMLQKKNINLPITPDSFSVDKNKTSKTTEDFTKALDEGKFTDRKIIASNNSCYAIPDINQTIKGHFLVVPRRKVDSVCDLSAEEMGESFKLIKSCEDRIKESYNTKNMQFKIEIYDLPVIKHPHFHIYPIINK